MQNIKVSIFLPEDHPLAQINVKDRAKTAKQLIEFALQYQEQINLLRSDMQQIKDILLNGLVLPEQPKEIIDADTELIKGFLNI